MREIKFRAWVKPINKMAEVTGWVSNSFFLKSGTGSGSSDIDNIILMQYTGLHDKNGKEIYEGDIVKYNTGEEWIVKWSPMYLRVILADNRKGYNLTQDLGAHEVEVIGNIYENLELLK